MRTEVFNQLLVDTLNRPHQRDLQQILSDACEDQDIEAEGWRGTLTESSEIDEKRVKITLKDKQHQFHLQGVFYQHWANILQGKENKELAQEAIRMMGENNSLNWLDHQTWADVRKELSGATRSQKVDFPTTVKIGRHVEYDSNSFQRNGRAGADDLAKITRNCAPFYRRLTSIGIAGRRASFPTTAYLHYVYSVLGLRSPALNAFVPMMILTQQSPVFGCVHSTKGYHFILFTKDSIRRLVEERIDTGVGTKHRYQGQLS